MLVIVLIIVIVVLLHRYWTRNHDYWSKRNVKHDPPLPFFGNHLPNILLKRDMPGIGAELYHKYKGEKMVGYYTGTNPELYIRDPEIIKRILNMDFEYFTGRGSRGTKEKDPLMENVIFMSGDKWRDTRQKLTPAFSPGRLRAMFPLLQQCTEKLQDTLQDLASTKEEINTYGLMTRFLLQFVASCGFGVELNSLDREHSRFVELAKSLFTLTKLQSFFIALSELLPKKLINPKIVNQELEDIIINMTRKICEERNFKPSGRNDMMDTILKIGKEDSTDGEDENNIDFIAAQLFALLIGGFETTSTSISFTLHQLAYHPEIQETIHREIDGVLSKYDNRLTYDGIAELSRLDMAWNESMRLFSPFSGISRICEKEYTIPGTEVTLIPGVRVIVPSQALHMDPDYFESPHEFRPERFADAAVKCSNAYVMFGDGPKKCLGIRLANMMSIAALAAVLHRFSVAPGPSSQYQPKSRHNPVLLQNLEGGLPLKFIPRVVSN